MEKASTGKALLWLLLLFGAAVSEEHFFKSSLPPPEKLHKILFLLPIYLPSHVMAVAPLAVALAGRGHEVHMLCDLHDPYKLPNVTCIHFDTSFPKLDEIPLYSNVGIISHLKLAKKFIEQVTELMYNSQTILQLHEKRKEYDAIVIDAGAIFALYPFAHGTTYALFNTLSLNPCQSAEFGNVQNPAYVTSGVYEYPQPYSFVDRVENLFSTLAFCYVYRWISHHAEEHISKIFPGLPSRLEVERNASLHMVSSSSAIEGPIPLLPTQVEVGGLLLRPNLPLPQDIEDFVEGDDPVIYLSFGRTFHPQDVLHQKKREILISVLRKLPYKVIFKIRKQQIKRVGNILYHNDVPQQDILAHRNVKLYISHCGAAGVHEAVHHGVPILGLPFVWEHMKTARVLAEAGVAIQLSWDSLTGQEFEKAVTEMMVNPSYRHKMAVMSRRFRDQPQTPLDRAVYWTEYIARHRGAPHLQSPAKKLSWIQILGIDLIAGVLLVLYFVYFLLKGLYKLNFTRVTSILRMKKLQ